MFDLRLRERLIEHDFAVPIPKKPFPPRPEPCLSCPPFDIFEAAVLGGAVRESSELVFGEKGELEDSIKGIRKLNPELLEKKLATGAMAGFKELQNLQAKSMKQFKELLG